MRYFQNQAIQANEDFRSADGWGADGYEDSDGYEAVDDMEEFTGQELNAAANPNIKKGFDSQPYIVTATIGTADVTNVEFLDANTRQFSSTATGITYSYGIPNITYQQFLATIASGSIFEVGQLRIIASNTSTSVAQSQVLETVTVTTKEINGNVATRPFIPSLDSYQYTSTQIDIWYSFYVNGLTSVQIATGFAGSTIKCLFYPSKRVNQLQALNKGLGVTAYKNPKTNPALVKTATPAVKK